MSRRAVIIALWLVVGACSGLAATLVGRATDAQGNALRDLHLQLVNLETVRKITVATDERGTFRLELEPAIMPSTPTKWGPYGCWRRSP
jgi:hypothetical protein